MQVPTAVLVSAFSTGDRKKHSMNRINDNGQKFIFAKSELVRKIPIGESSSFVVENSFTELPQLISERSLEGSAADLSDRVREELKMKFLPDMEYIQMPKEKYGNRPLAVLSPQTRVVIEALCGSMRSVLPEKSRDTSFGRFELFGTDREDHLLIDFDITSCYEFIDHELLCDELILRGAHADSVRLLRELLFSLFGRSIGLPQGVESSHWLSDTYLDIVERSLGRRGIELHRYADDFRMIGSDTKEAYDLIQLAVEECRRIHLAISERKIKIRSTSDVVSEHRDKKFAFDEYIEDTQIELTEFIDAGSDYGPGGQLEIEPLEEEVYSETISRILQDWGNEEDSNRLSVGGAIALGAAVEMEERVDNHILDNLVKNNPIRLRRVMDYIRERDEVDDSDNWELMSMLCSHERSSAWQKVWILSTASLLKPGDPEVVEPVIEFARSHLDDPHEVVRAEAAWLLAKFDSLDLGRLHSLYTSSSSVTQIGLRAVAGKMSSLSPKEKSLSYYRNGGSLHSSAFEWGASS